MKIKIETIKKENRKPNETTRENRNPNFKIK